MFVLVKPEEVQRVRCLPTTRVRFGQKPFVALKDVPVLHPKLSQRGSVLLDDLFAATQGLNAPLHLHGGVHAACVFFSQILSARPHRKPRNPFMVLRLVVATRRAGRPTLRKPRDETPAVEDVPAAQLVSMRSEDWLATDRAHVVVVHISSPFDSASPAHSDEGA